MNTSEVPQDLVEKMLIAYHGCKPHPSNGLEEHMTAALRVALEDERVWGAPDDEELDAVEHTCIFNELSPGAMYCPSDVAQKVRDAACIFASNRRARLLNPKTLEERVSIEHEEGEWSILLDGQRYATCPTLDTAEWISAGLIAKLKEEQQ